LDALNKYRQSCAGCGKHLRYLPRSRGQEDGGQESKGEPGTEPAAIYQQAPPDLHRGQTMPPPESWQWIGHVRSDDGNWRAVALCKTLGGCWEALLATWQQGDLLCIPVRPLTPKGPPGEQPAALGE
jgi:hypothetical protein